MHHPVMMPSGTLDLVALRGMVATIDNQFAQGHRFDAATRTHGYYRKPVFEPGRCCPNTEWTRSESAHHGRRVPGSYRWANPGFGHGTAQHTGSMLGLFDSSNVTRPTRTHAARLIRQESTSVDAVPLVCGALSWNDGLPAWLGSKPCTVHQSVRAPRRHTFGASA